MKKILLSFFAIILLVAATTSAFGRSQGILIGGAAGTPASGVIGTLSVDKGGTGSATGNLSSLFVTTDIPYSLSNAFSLGTLLGSSATLTNPHRTGDATTGLYSLTATSISAAIGGVEKFRVDSTGIGESTVFVGGTTESLSGWLGGFPVQNLVLPSDIITTGTTDTVASTDKGALLIDKSATGVTHTLAAASATGFTDRFMFGVKNEGIGLSLVSSTSAINGSFEPFYIKQSDECWFTSRLSTEYGVNNCPAALYNPNLATGVLTTMGDTRTLISNTSTNARYYFNSAGLLATATGAGASRMYYDPTGLVARGSLIEGIPATNLYPNTSSNAYSSFYANSGIASIKTATATSPFGTSRPVATITEDTASSIHLALSQTATYDIGGTYSVGFFLKPNTETVVQIIFNSTIFGAGKYLNVDLTNAVAGTSSGVVSSLIEKLTNGWVYVRASAVADGGGVGQNGLVFTENNTSAARNPTRTGVGGSFYMYYHWIVKESVPSSPILTSSAVRLADVVTIDPAYTYLVNPVEGAVCINFALTANTVGGAVIADTVAAQNVLSLTATSLTSNDGTNTLTYGIAPATAGSYQNVCLNYGGATMNGAVNGVLAATSTYDGNMFSGLRFGTDKDGANGVNMYRRGYKLYPRKLSDSDLLRASATP